MNVPVWLLAGLALAFLLSTGLLFLGLARRRPLFRRLKESEESESQAQKALSDTGERLTTVLEGCGAGVLIVDGSLAVTYANQSLARSLGHAPSDVVGKTLIEAILSDELSRTVRAALEDGEPQTLELRDIGPEKRSYAVSVVPRLATGEAHVFAHDITDVRRLERVRQDFVANVSHELRTPLASIRAMSETLESGAVEGSRTAKRFLRTIITEADRLRRIADDLLVLSRAESVEPQIAPFGLSDLLHEIFARFKTDARRASVELAHAIPAGIDLTANRDQIEEAVVNLVDNAIKYTSEGGRVVLSAYSDDCAIRIRVSDDGIGIMQEDVPRIFERFYRVDKARSRQTGGTGLGLAIVKHITESHGGTVIVETEFNRGSTFTLEFPVGAREIERRP